MPRELLKRYLPTPERIKRARSLRFLGTILHDPQLWHITRHSVARPMACGLFVTILPLPMQLLLADFLAISVRANLPLTVSLVWLANPTTMPPAFLAHYQIG